MNPYNVLITYCIFIGCVQNEYNDHQPANSIEKEKGNIHNRSQISTNMDYRNSDEIYIGFLGYKIISNLKKEIRSGEIPQELEELGCHKWVLRKEQLKDILKIMRKVEEVEWYATCYNFPCTYTCKVSDGKSEYDMYINGASYILLNNEKETLYFILKETSKIFLKPCDCCE